MFGIFAHPRHCTAHSAEQCSAVTPPAPLNSASRSRKTLLVGKQDAKVKLTGNSFFWWLKTFWQRQSICFIYTTQQIDNCCIFFSFNSLYLLCSSKTVWILAWLSLTVCSLWGQRDAAGWSLCGSAGWSQCWAPRPGSQWYCGNL